MAEISMMQQLELMQASLLQRPHHLRMGALFSQTVLLEVDEDEFYLRFEKGALVDIQPGPSRKIAWRFAFRTNLTALQEFWQRYPKPGYHDIFGLVKINQGQIDGDILELVKNLRFFKEFMALPRAGSST